MKPLVVHHHRKTFANLIAFLRTTDPLRQAAGGGQQLRRRFRGEPGKEINRRAAIRACSERPPKADRMAICRILAALLPLALCEASDIGFSQSPARNNPLRLGFSNATSSEAAGNDHRTSPTKAEPSARQHDALHRRHRGAGRRTGLSPSPDLFPVFLPSGRAARLARRPRARSARRAKSAILQRRGLFIFDDLCGEERRTFSGSSPAVVGGRSDLSP